jgi:hypothetical protein
MRRDGVMTRKRVAETFGACIADAITRLRTGKSSLKAGKPLVSQLVDECLKSGGGFKTDEHSRATMRAAVAFAVGQILPLRLENLTMSISGRSLTLVRPRVRRPL